MLSQLYRPMVMLLLYATCLYSASSAQVSMHGPSCVVPGTVYQYDIKGDWKEGDNVSICVEGGVLVATDKACIDTTSISSIRLQWNDELKQGKISLTSLAGTALLYVTITSPFSAGVIQESKKQIINFDKVPVSLFCTQAGGGSCAPFYTYQWQASADNVKWVDLPGKTDSNLSFSTPTKQATFFRRKTIEVNSRTEGYSNEVVVFVSPKTKK